jgi:hypothetical protein
MLGGASTACSSRGGSCVLLLRVRLWPTRLVPVPAAAAAGGGATTDVAAAAPCCLSPVYWLLLLLLVLLLLALAACLRLYVVAPGLGPSNTRICAEAAGGQRQIKQDASMHPWLVVGYTVCSQGIYVCCQQTNHAWLGDQHVPVKVCLCVQA